MTIFFVSKEAFEQMRRERDEALARVADLTKLPTTSCLACLRGGHADTGVTCYGPVGILDCTVTMLRAQLDEVRARRDDAYDRIDNITLILEAAHAGTNKPDFNALLRETLHWKREADRAYDKADRNLVAQMRAETRAEAASAAYDRVTAALEGGVGDPLAQTIRELKEARELLRHAVDMRTRLEEMVKSAREERDVAQDTLTDIADVFGVGGDQDPKLVEIAEELVGWLPEYKLDDGTDDEANVRERAEYAAAELRKYHGKSLGELTSDEVARVRREALAEASSICRAQASSGGPGNSWYLDCAEAIDEAADEPRRSEP